MVYLSFAILFLVTAVLGLELLLMYNGVSLHYFRGWLYDTEKKKKKKNNFTNNI